MFLFKIALLAASTNQLELAYGVKTICDSWVWVFFPNVSFLFAKQNARERCASILVEATGLPFGMVWVVGPASYPTQLETQEQKVLSSYPFQSVSDIVGRERTDTFSSILLFFRMRVQRLLVGLDGHLSYLGKLEMLYAILKLSGTSPEVSCKWNKGNLNDFTSTLGMWGRHTLVGKHTTYIMCNILGYFWQIDWEKNLQFSITFYIHAIDIVILQPIPSRVGLCPLPWILAKLAICFGQ